MQDNLIYQIHTAFKANATEDEKKELISQLDIVKNITNIKALQDLKQDTKKLEQLKQLPLAAEQNKEEFNKLKAELELLNKNITKYYDE